MGLSESSTLDAGPATIANLLPNGNLLLFRQRAALVQTWSFRTRSPFLITTELSSNSLHLDSFVRHVLASQ